VLHSGDLLFPATLTTVPRPKSSSGSSGTTNYKKGITRIRERAAEMSECQTFMCRGDVYVTVTDQMRLMIRPSTRRNSSRGLSRLKVAHLKIAWTTSPTPCRLITLQLIRRYMRREPSYQGGSWGSARWIIAQSTIALSWKRTPFLLVVQLFDCPRRRYLY